MNHYESPESDESIPQRSVISYIVRSHKEKKEKKEIIFDLINFRQLHLRINGFLLILLFLCADIILP